jgi:hypothetical protein
LIFDETAILQKKHFDDGVDLWIGKVIIDFALLFVTSMLSEVFARERMVIKMICYFWISNHLWIIVVCVAILALQSDHFAFFSQMLSQSVQAEFGEAAAIALQRIGRAFSAFHVSFEISNREDLHFAASAAFMADLYFIYDIFQKL